LVWLHKRGILIDAVNSLFLFILFINFLYNLHTPLIRGTYTNLLLTGKREAVTAAAWHIFSRKDNISMIVVHIIKSEGVRGVDSSTPYLVSTVVAGQCFCSEVRTGFWFQALVIMKNA
jgi:hypothetical protein